MAITHTKNVNGWLPYGSDDPSILLQHPLTSDPAAYFATKGTTTVSGSGLQTFDPVKGMCPNGSGGYRIQSMAGYLDLDHAGQISYEIEREFACTPSAYYSYGYLPAGDEYALSLSPSAGTAVRIGTKYTSGTFGFSHSAAAATLYPNSSGKDDFVRVNVGWSGGRLGGKVSYAIDGQVLTVATRNDPTLTGLFVNLYLGGDRNTAGRYMSQHFIRNLQISTKPPMFPTVPALRNIAMVSDSMNQSDSITSGAYKDAVTSWTMRRELTNRGLFFGSITWSSEGGARLDDSIDGGTTDYIYTQLASALATKPEIVVIRGGTNDCTGGRPSQAGWQAYITNYINTCLAEPSVRVVMFLGIPTVAGAGPTYNDAAFKTNRSLGEAKIQAACDAWRAANPTDPRKVIFANDIYARLGGEYPPPGTFIGQVSGLYDDLHFSGYGHYIHGKAIADWIVSTLR